MNCDELRDDYGLFAIGGLEGAEREEIRTHLIRGCTICATGVRDARGWANLVSAAATGPQPPPRLRKRILAAAGAAPRAWPWRLAFAGAATLAVIAFLGLVSVSQQRGAENAAMREAISFMEAPETRTVSFGDGKPAPPRGRVFVNPNEGVLLIAAHLPPPPTGRTYEMWIVPKTGKPAPAGLFASNAAGSVFYVCRVKLALPSIGAIAITEEDAGGAPAPTSQPIIVAAL